MRYLNNLKINRRLFLIFGIIILITLAGIIQNHYKSKKIKNELGTIYQTKLFGWHHLNQAEQLIHQSQTMISESFASLDQGKQEVAITQANQAKITLQSVNQPFNKFKDKINLNNKKNKALIDKMELKLNQLNTATTGFASALAEKKETSEMLDYYNNAYLPVYQNLIGNLQSYSERQLDQIENDYNAGLSLIQNMQTNAFFVLIIIILLLGSLGYALELSLTRPLAEVRAYLERLSTGELPKNFKNIGKDEIGNIKQSLNRFIENLRKTAYFANQIGEGNLEIEHQPLSENDTLGNSLIEMQKGLKKAQEEENKRKEEDEKRNWATQGLAKFADILRKDNDDVNKLTDEVLSNLIDYVGANQGGLFLYNDEKEEDKHLELTASYAFNRKKYQNKKIALGEGLVGTCALEMETIHMTQLPNEYIEITSGLGNANPNSLLIVPLKLDDKLFGIIELASFYDFEPHHIEFVEKLSESIASTISSVKVNARTAALLEESKNHAEEMASQEEELRQNLEELQATQEEMERMKKREAEKNQEMLEKEGQQRQMVIKILDQLPEKIYLKDKDGNMMIVNAPAATDYHLKTQDMIGKSDFDFLDKKTAQKITDEEEEIKKTGTKTWTEDKEINGEKRFFKITKMPFYVEFVNQTGLLSIQNDITDYKQIEEEANNCKKEKEKLLQELEEKKE